MLTFSDLGWTVLTLEKHSAPQLKMGYSATLSLSAPGKDQGSLNQHFQGLHERAANGGEAQNECAATGAGEHDEYAASSFWRAPVEKDPVVAPTTSELLIEVRFVACNDGTDKEAVARLLYVDEDFHEHQQVTHAAPYI